MPDENLSPQIPRRQFWRGVQAILPILVGVFPFGMIYGALAVKADIPFFPAASMSFITFAGSSQFVATQMVRQAAPVVITVLTMFVINLRHALYSASVAGYVRHLSPAWKLGLAYLLTDEAYAVTISNYRQEGSQGNQQYFFLGAGLALWLCWQISTLLGILLGAVIPESWSLDFALPLTFIALIVPSLKERAGITAALTSAVVGILAYAMPFKLSILTAALLGITAGLFVEKKR